MDADHVAHLERILANRRRRGASVQRAPSASRSQSVGSQQAGVTAADAATNTADGTSGIGGARNVYNTNTTASMRAVQQGAQYYGESSSPPPRTAPPTGAFVAAAGPDAHAMSPPGDALPAAPPPASALHSSSLPHSPGPQQHQRLAGYFSAATAAAAAAGGGAAAAAGGAPSGSGTTGTVHGGMGPADLFAKGIFDNFRQHPLLVSDVVRPYRGGGGGGSGAGMGSGRPSAGDGSAGGARGGGSAYRRTGGLVESPRGARRLASEAPPPIGDAPRTALRQGLRGTLPPAAGASSSPDRGADPMDSTFRALQSEEDVRLLAPTTQRNPFRRQPFEEFQLHPDYRLPLDVLDPVVLANRPAPPRVSETAGTPAAKIGSVLGPLFAQSQAGGAASSPQQGAAAAAARSASPTRALGGPPPAAPLYNFADCLKALSAGDWFLKWTRRGECHKRYVWLDADRAVLLWAKSPSTNIFLASQLNLANVVSMQPMCVVDEATQRTVFKVHIVTRDRFLHLGTEVRDKFDVWYDTLSRIVQQFQGLSKQNAFSAMLAAGQGHGPNRVARAPHTRTALRAAAIADPEVAVGGSDE